MNEEENGIVITGKLKIGILLDYIKHTFDQWEIIEIPSNEETKTRTIKFTRNEEWKYSIDDPT